MNNLSAEQLEMKNRWERKKQRESVTLGSGIVFSIDRSYRKHKGTACSCCGFIPISEVQLDVDHKNGNHQDSRTENLWTLCANCHRLKTHKPELFVVAWKIYESNRK